MWLLFKRFFGLKLKEMREVQEILYQNVVAGVGSFNIPSA